MRAEWEQNAHEHVLLQNANDAYAIRNMQHHALQHVINMHSTRPTSHPDICETFAYRHVCFKWNGGARDVHQYDNVN